jgi:hypothetical protein
MPVRANPQDATRDWVQRLGASTEKISRGIDQVTQAPGQLAAAQSQRWLARIQAAADKWKSRVASVTLQEWQTAMKEVGVPRIAQGAQAKQGKFLAFMNEFLPYLNQGVQQVDKMPKLTLEDSINRAVAMIRHNAAFKRGGGAARR